MKHDNKADDYGGAVIRNVQTVARWSGAALALGLVFAFFMAGSWPGAGIIAIAALACYVFGSAFGFLFSIPRSAQNAETATAIPGVDKVKEAQRPRDNTNLEQISDWLVKILVGAGLVNLGKMKDLLEASAAKLGHCLLLAKGGAAGMVQIAETAGVSNGPPVLPGMTNADIVARVLASGVNGSLPFVDAYYTGFCLFLILYFLVSGFLTGYLITKLWLPFVILRSSLAMVYLQLEADEEEARKIAARKVLREFGLTSADNPPPSRGTREEFASVQGVSDDPLKGKFGGKPESNGLILTAEVAKLDDIDDDYFRITLKVITDGKRQLNRSVTFHLHPTFVPAAVSVLSNNNVAELTRASWGAFTVGATIEGEETKLELDLAELSGVPDLFKSR